jgi:CHAT domain-containing protein/Tfp pilus assembly protein PilF
MTLPMRLLVILLWLTLSTHVSAAWDGPPDDASLRIQQAQALQEKGKSEEARQAYEAILRDLRARPVSPHLGHVLNELSKLASGRGDYELAINLAQESASTFHQIGDTKGESHSVNIKGLAEIDLGNYQSALQDFMSALALTRSVHDAENEVQVLNNIGSSYYFEGKYLEAMRNYETAKQTVSQISSEHWQEYWRQVTDFNQATLFQKLGRYEKALEIYRSVESSSKALTPGDRAHIEANLGTLYRRLGDPWKALETYKNAQLLFSKDRDADGEIGVLKNIGIVYALDLHDLPNAQRIFRRVLELASDIQNRREEMQAHLYLGEAYLLQRSLEFGKAEFDRVLAMAKELGTPEEQWKALYGLGQIEEKQGDREGAESQYRAAIALIEKARVQLQLSALRAEFLGDKRNVYDSLISLFLRRNDIENVFLFLERSRARNFQDRFAKGESSPLTLGEVRDRLDPQTALIEYWTAGDQVAALWCTRERSSLVVRRIGQEEQKKLSAVLDALPNGVADWREQMAGMSALIPAEWLSEQQSIRHIVIVPDNWIATVPFDILPAGEGQFLIERADISYLPSAILLRRPAPKDTGILPPWSQQLVAFGDPVVPTAGQQAMSAFDAIPAPLPYSAEEVRSIAAQAAGKSALFLGPADLKNTFLGGKANSALLLHVSTHAVADVYSPEDSRLLFSPADPASGTADWLFLRELYDLNLSNVRMAVLSACDTERGKLERGEGLQAFSRALLAAGSHSSLTTLWKVDDRATAEFMKQFYHFAVERRMTKAEALRQVKLKFLQSRSAYESPRYWAAFVISGDARTSVPAVLSWRDLFLGIATALAAGVLFVGLWSRRRRHRQDNS